MIYLTFDSEAEARLITMQEKLAEAVPGVRGPKGRVRPHLTLLVFDAMNRDTLFQPFSLAAKQMCSVKLELKTIAAFTGRRNVLYVEPSTPPLLVHCYHECHKYFSAFDIVPAYRRPACWKPHVTLAKGMNAALFSRAMDRAISEWVPIEATTLTAQLIHAQKPLEVLASETLG